MLVPVKGLGISTQYWIGKHNKELKGKMNEEVEGRLKVMKKAIEARFATYIGNTMLQFQDKEAIMPRTTLSKCDFA
jgi:chromatin remodeling complex protein RSC6